MSEEFPKEEPIVRKEQERSPEQKESIALLNNAEALLMEGDEEGSNREAAAAWEKAMHILDAETIGKEFATTAIVDILIAKIDALPVEKRLAIADAILAHNGLESIFLKNWVNFPGIDQSKIIIRAGKRKAGFHLLPYANKLNAFTPAQTASLLAASGDQRGADAWMTVQAQAAFLSAIATEEV